MTPLVAILIIIGILFIIVSCFFMNKQDSKKGDVELLDETVLSPIVVKKRMEDTLLEVTDETINKTEDELSKISNEKIIAVNDFSNMVLDKINNNHEEVVFLYHMLNEKEAEIKDLMKNIEDISKKNTDTSIQNNPIKNQEYMGEYEFTANKNEIQEDDTQLEAMNNTQASNMEEIKPVIPAETHMEQMKSKNERILSMYKDGMNVVAIAKELGLGQGEVKLIIDLYQH